MPERSQSPPDTLLVLRYMPRSRRLFTIVGDRRARLPRASLRDHAAAALADNAFVCHTTGGDPHLPGDQVCFVPRGDHCEILAISTNGWRRTHGDHRRSLIEILNDIAAAVARGRLHFVNDAQLRRELARDEEILACSIDDSTSLARARAAVDMALTNHGVGRRVRGRFMLCVSEATTNVLLHGGGAGMMSLRLGDDRLRAVVADNGPGLDFLNWTDAPPSGRSASDAASMGYGYKVILDNLDAVYLHTGSEGTTLLLDHTLGRRPATAGHQPAAAERRPAGERR